MTLDEINKLTGMQLKSYNEIHYNYKDMSNKDYKLVEGYRNVYDDYLTCTGSFVIEYHGNYWRVTETISKTDDHVVEADETFNFYKAEKVKVVQTQYQSNDCIAYDLQLNKSIK